MLKLLNRNDFLKLNETPLFLLSTFPYNNNLVPFFIFNVKENKENKNKKKML